MILTLGALAGCQTTKPKAASFSPPSSAAVAAPMKDVRSSVARAKDRAAKISRDGALPGSAVIRELEQDLQEANLKAAQADQALLEYSGKVGQQTADLNAAVDAKNAALREAEYWHGKQVKALRELWFWRGLAALVAGSVLAFFGLRFAGKTLL